MKKYPPPSPMARTGRLIRKHRLPLEMLQEVAPTAADARPSANTAARGRCLGRSGLAEVAVMMTAWPASSRSASPIRPSCR